MAWDETYIIGRDGRVVGPDRRPREIVEAERAAKAAAENARWYDAMISAGHDPVLDAKGLVDMDAYTSPETDEDMEHCGPRCKTCGWVRCEFCDDRTDNIPTCTGVDNG